MRLLQLDQGLLKFTDDYLYHFPPYAILSHTWGKNEVKFQDIIAQTAKRSKKIDFCGEQAAKDGLRYFWVDTCCINQSDQNEVSRSIVSMFRWYQMAAKCYVYLADVSAQGDWELQLRNSRWFTRGWTLQELLAPTIVEFFSEEGTFLGDKRSLENTIHEVTGIPIRALRGDPLHNFTVDERFAWSSGRSTLYKEDKAYCLLGIFNVFMPLIYGEEDHAYTRLKKAVAESSKKYNPDSQDRDVQDSFVFPEMQKRRLNIDPRHQHTCEWILDIPEYCQWKSSTHGLLWIKGKPGAGKSTIMAFLYEILEKMIIPGIRLEFFFSARGTELQRNIEGMFRSLINQLSIYDEGVRENVRHRYHEKIKVYGSSRWSWSDLELREMFTYNAVNVANDKPVMIFIDALDEAGEDAAMKIAEYFHRLNEQVRLKICLSCRHYPVVTQSRCLEIIVEHHNQPDIIAYINDKLSISSDLKQQLIKKSAGGFQWASLIVDLAQKDINRGKSHKEIARCLDEVPPELKDAYIYILEKVIDRRDCSLTLQLFQWVCLALRPLLLSQIQVALDEDLNRMRVNALSGGLIQIVQGTRGETLQISHQSVNDFMSSDGFALLLSMENPPHTIPNDVLAWGHSQIYQRCIKYLGSIKVERLEKFEPGSPELLTQELDSLEQFDSKYTMLHESDFVMYAASQVFFHAKRAGAGWFPSQDLVTKISNLNQAIHTWSDIQNWSSSDYKGPREGSHPLQVLSYMGMTDLCNRVLSSGVDPNVRDRLSRTPLHYAALGNHKEVARILIKADADLNAIDIMDDMPLDKADLALGTWLIEQGATSNKLHEADLIESLRTRDILRSKSLIAKLMEDRPDWCRELSFQMILVAAITRRNEPVMNLLLSDALNPKLEISLYHPLLNALGHSSSQETLLHYITRLPLGPVFYSTVKNAFENDDSVVLQMLITRGKDLDLWFIMHHYVSEDARHVPKGLLDSLIQTRDDIHKDYFVYVATQFGYAETVKALIALHADVNYQGRLGTPIVVASRKGYKTIVEMLIAAGAEMIGKRGVPFTNALRSAVIHGQHEIAEVLRNAGARYRNGMVRR